MSIKSLEHTVEHGLLADNHPKQSIPFVGEFKGYATTGEEIRYPAEVDPLKVDLNPALPPATLFTKLGNAHNALVDETKTDCDFLETEIANLGYRLNDRIVYLQERCTMIEQRIESNDRGVAGALDKAFAQIAALEQRLCALEQQPGQPAEQKAWPRLSTDLADYGSSGHCLVRVLEELARIRTVLGVKESE